MHKFVCTNVTPKEKGRANLDAMPMLMSNKQNDSTYKFFIQKLLLTTINLTEMSM